MIINQCNLTGEIVSITPVNGILLVIKQKVAGRFETHFPIYLPVSLKEDLKKLSLKAGDEIVVLNGLIYTKNNEWRIKVSTINQLQKITERQEVDLGIEDAEEKFI